MQTPMQLRVTAAQAELLKRPHLDCPLDHEFTNQFYLRTVHVPAGALVISKIFKAEFPFFISKGKVSVWVEGVGVKHMEAPYWGMTSPASRRVIMCHTDVDWTTFHRTDSKNEEQVEAEVIYNPEKDVPLDITPEMLQELKG